MVDASRWTATVNGTDYTPTLAIGASGSLLLTITGGLTPTANDVLAYAGPADEIVMAQNLYLDAFSGLTLTT